MLTPAKLLLPIPYDDCFKDCTAGIPRPDSDSNVEFKVRKKLLSQFIAMAVVASFTEHNKE